MKNILFSTTRQWNIGDEIILFGAINLMKEVFPEGINPIIYNRHPDLRTDFQKLDCLHNVKLFAADEESLRVDANFRLGFRDNSIKSSTDAQFIDLVVLAGTPEWSNQRCFDLYELIEKYDIPVIALGIGNCIQEEADCIMRNLHRFQLFTVRSPEFIPLLEPYISPKPVHLPCPSICSSPVGMNRKVEAVKHIGLIYSCDVSRSEVNNCVTAETYGYLLELYRKIKQEYPDYKISMVCHYIDEVPFAYSDFPNLDVFYSFDAKDYYRIYNQFDLVLGCRVHGIGCSASMGIPGIAIVHDFRGETVKGFQADLIRVGQPMEEALAVIDRVIRQAPENSRMLAEHIQETRERYHVLLRGITLDQKSFDHYSPSRLLPTNDVFENRERLRAAYRELKGIPDPIVEQQLSCIKEQDYELHLREERINQLCDTLSHRDNQIAAQDALLNSQAEQINQLNDILGHHESQISAQDALLNSQAEQINQLNDTLGHHESQISAQDALLNSQAEQIKQLENTVEYGEIQIQNQKEEEEKLRAKLHQKNIEIRRQEKEIDDLYNSLSWRITKPLRMIVNFFARLRKGRQQR